MMATQDILPMQSEAEVRETYALMRQLRQAMSEEAYLEQVGRLMRGQGYRLAGLREGGVLRCVAGYRLGESLSWGRYLYVDDLVSDLSQRSKGHGKRMLDWLAQEARRQGCAELHLDSGTQRLEAHRFYLRERMDIVFFHFKKDLRQHLS